MDIKKNPRKELENFSKIFFQIGIVLSLFIIYAFMEHKTYEKTYDELGQVVMVEEMKEDIPIVQIQKPTPPPKNIPKVVEIIKIIEDDEKIEETIIESTETDESESVVVIDTDDIEEVHEAEEVIEDIPFMLIEDVPIYPGCKGNNTQLKKCFTKGVTKHFSKKFDVNLATELGLSKGKKRLYVLFTIGNDGKIVNVKTRGPHPVLEKEVTEIINALPKMTPGKQRGVPVRVSFSIPITFEVR
ncbi:energy transducer TonB [Polaribacter sp. Asnod6-C07]|uniref:energy transducer TonB n=1 Tax=Polaribacter sp. Asnod6-C07 TaxID=3160582 RepID=UPI00386FF6D2